MGRASHRWKMGLLLSGALVGCAPRPAASLPTRVPVSADASLTPYRAPEGFAVLMPTTLERKERTEQTVAGAVTTHLAEAKHRTEPVTFTAASSELPAMATAFLGNTGVLDSALDSLVKQLHGTLRSKHALKMEGVDAVDFTVDSPRGAVMGRLLLGGGQLYSLTATYPGDRPPPPSIRIFLDSFQRTRDL